MLIDEGCRDLRSVAPIATYADGIVIKLSKCGGIREALRMIHAARALDLQVMLGCMIESELGIAQAAQLGSLADHIDLDGHLLISSRPFTGLGLAGRAARALRRSGTGRRACLTGSRSSPAASSPMSHAKTAHGILRYADREVVAVVDDGAGRPRRRGRRPLRAPRRSRSWAASPRPCTSARTCW